MLYGWRGKIGLMHPAPGVAEEVEFHRMVPKGVAVLSTRIPLYKVTPEGLEEMEIHIEEAASLLAQADPDIIAFGCTTGSLLKGIGYDKEIIGRIQKHVGIQATTTATAVINALRVLGVKKLAIATPYYSDELNKREIIFLEDNGFKVTALKNLKPANPTEMEKAHTRFVHPEQMYKLAREVFTEDADAMFISCMGLGVMDIIETLEGDLGKPVITSIQATVWESLRKIHIKDQIEGLGRLFTL